MTVDSPDVGSSCEVDRAGLTLVDEPYDGNYFVSTYPPFSTWTKENIADVSRLLDTAPAEPTDVPLGLYVHIPFCVKRCDYCYYLAYTGKSDAQIDEYLTAIVDELAIHRRAPALCDRPLSFIYFGGGTPSLPRDERLAAMMEDMQGIAPWSDVQEVSFECAPQTVSGSKLRMLKDHGVTRLSLGIQTMDDDLLRANGRVHSVQDVERAYAAIRKIGFPIVNVDLIVGLIGETEGTFLTSLNRVIGMKPDSVTVYQLEIPRNTPLFGSVSKGHVEPVAWSAKRQRLLLGFDRLEAEGYQVRSAYAAVRDPVRHRFVYQDAQYHGADLLGLGVASFSYVNGCHFQNAASYHAYLDLVRSGAAPLGRAYVLSAEERMIREFILQLKLGGADAGYFKKKFGVDIHELFAVPLGRLEREGRVIRTERGSTLTRSGLVRIDGLLPMFYRTCHRNVRYS